MNLVSFIVRRALRVLIVLLGLTVVTFFLARAVANPVDLMLPLSATAEQRETLTHQLGLDLPLWEQFVNYVGDALHGDFGESIWSGDPALQTILSRVPASIILATAAMLIAIVVGLTLGIAGGIWPGTIVDRAAATVAALGLAIPDFWLGILLILVFAVELGLLPTSGSGGIEYLILPAVTLSLRPAARLARVAREAVLDEMRKDYVLAARARGLGTGEIVRRHVLKNVIVPTSSVFGYDFLLMFTGDAIGVEVVFNWPGVGRLAVEAAAAQDVVLVSAAVIVLGVIVAFGNLALDIFHSLIDRRITVS